MESMDIKVRLSHGVKALGIDDAIPQLVQRHLSDGGLALAFKSAVRLDGRDVLYMFTREDRGGGRFVFVCLEPEWRELGEHPWASDTPWPDEN
jgi:hypothetical protein